MRSTGRCTRSSICALGLEGQLSGVRHDFNSVAQGCHAGWQHDAVGAPGLGAGACSGLGGWGGIGCRGLSCGRRRCRPRARRSGSKQQSQHGAHTTAWTHAHRTTRYDAAMTQLARLVAVSTRRSVARPDVLARSGRWRRCFAPCRPKRSVSPCTTCPGKHRRGAAASATRCCSEAAQARPRANPH